MMTIPDCIGNIKDNYSIECSKCEYAAVCTATALKFRTEHGDMFPIGNNDDKPEETDTKKT